MITDNTQVVINLLKGIDELIEKYEDQLKDLRKEAISMKENPDHGSTAFLTGRFGEIKIILENLKKLRDGGDK